ncbi:MFS transporter [Pigmentiphaga litoralis]|uniref:Bug family tripartite tricarboxylate transporter substrate binding protein n=1 Tax=Pigmentiphaga litoralis TaxID=516702 RepID=UPI00167393C6|nr:tripartite tricarboxylate transporter substrate binding protein [Pigmentiphaga litoralis]GGX01044.1 MFS transporter [Pigmentiphaga litoralis]
MFRHLLGRLPAVLLVASALTGSHVQAQTYPDRPIKVLLPFSPGGNPDTVARILAQELTKTFGQTVLIDNRAGANGIIATEAVANAPADGYTLLYTTGSHVINPLLYKKLPYDTAKDFLPVSLVGVTRGQVLVANPRLAATNVKELVALARPAQSNITYGSAGVGNTMHMVAEYFNSKAGTHLVHIPYKGAAPAMNAVISGEVQLAFLNPVSAIEQVKQGKLKALAVTGSSRIPQLPDVPTVKEAGVAGFEVEGGWQGFFAPAGTPADVIAKLNRTLDEVLKAPEMTQRFASMGLDVAGGSPQDMAVHLQKETTVYAQIAEAAKIQKE